MVQDRGTRRRHAKLNPITLKLEAFTRLSDDDRRALDGLIDGRVRKAAAREDIVNEGDPPRDMRLMLAGWACRYKQMEDGRRQIVGIFLPGDICDLNAFVLREMDHSVGTLTPVTYAEVPRPVLEEVTLGHPRVMLALWWEALVDAAIAREWILNLGQRSAFERIAHLFCEIHLRLRTVGLVRATACDLPVTQADLAEITGLSAVHVNRTLQELRAEGLIVLKGRELRITDLGALMRAAHFNPNYLHLDQEGRHLDANG